MALGPTVTLRFLGDTNDVQRSITRVGTAIGLLGAGSAAAGVAVGAGLAAIPLGIAGIGIAAQAQTESVKASFTSLKDHVVAETTRLSAPFESVLLNLSDRARETFDRIGPGLGRMFETAAPMAERLGTAVLRLVEGAMPGLETALANAGPVIDVIARGIEDMGPAIGQFFANMSAGAPGAASALQTLFSVVQTALPAIGSLLGFLATAAPVLIPLATGIYGVAQAVKAWQIAQIALNLAMMLGPWGWVVLAIGLVVGALIYAWNNFETFRNIVIGVWEAIKSFIGSAVDQISGIVQWFGELPMMIRNWFEATKQNAIQKAMELVEWLRGLPGRIMAAIGNLGRLLWNAGGDLLRGLWDGISAAAGWLRSQISTFFGNLLPGWAKDFLGIGSPSKVFRDEIGKWIPKGMAVGIEANMGSVKDAAAGLRDAAMIDATPGSSDFRIPHSSSSINGRPSRFELHITGNSRDLLATLIMEMQRTGKLQLRAV